MIIINYNDYSNPYDESNDNKTKIKEWIKKYNESATSMCGNKNNNNRNRKYKIISNNHNNNNDK